MRFAYADPPYEGHASKYQREAKANGRVSSEVDHAALIADLISDFPDGWALSMKTNSLRSLLPLCPEKARVASWAKPFVPAYRGIRPVYSWEPVVVVGGRAKELDLIVVDSLVSSNRQGLKPRKTNAPLGGKPPVFCRWVLNMLGYQDEDEMVDIFPGTGMMSSVAAQGVLV